MTDKIAIVSEPPIYRAARSCFAFYVVVRGGLFCVEEVEGGA